MNDSRYAAPVAVVADLDEALVAARPRIVVTGVWLLWIQLVLGIPGMINQVLTPSPAVAGQMSIVNIVLVVTAVIMFFSVVLYAWLNWKCWQGRNWARIVHLVFLGIGMIMIYWALPAIFRKSTLQGVAYVVQMLLNIAGVSLLFTRPAGDWYRALREARR